MGKRPFLGKMFEDIEIKIVQYTVTTHLLQVSWGSNEIDVQASTSHSHLAQREVRKLVSLHPACGPWERGNARVKFRIKLF